MPQHDLDIANASGASVRADINNALVALGSTMKGASAPAAPIAGLVWIEDDSPSSTVWTVRIYDGAAWTVKGWFDTTNDRFLPANAPIWGGTAGGLSDARTITVAQGLTALAAGMTFEFLNGGSANTGTGPTLQVNSLSAVEIRRADDTVVAAGDLPASALIRVTHDGTRFRLPGPARGWNVVGSADLASVALADFTLPSAFTAFDLLCVNVRPGTDGASILLRCSGDGGATFDAGATNYTQVILFGQGATASCATGDGSAIDIGTGAQDNGAANLSRWLIYPGSASRQFQVVSGGAHALENTPTWRVSATGAVRGATGAKNAIRVLVSSGTFTSGNLILMGLKP